MFGIIATLTVQDGTADELEKLLKEAAPICMSDAEPGCVYYQPARLADDPNVFKVFEVYIDEAAFGDHRETPHFQPLKEAFGRVLAKPPEVDRLQVIR